MLWSLVQGKFTFLCLRSSRYRLILIARAAYVVLSVSLAILFCSSAWAASPLAVIKSERNAVSYGDQHLGEFEEGWLAFKQSLDSANVRYDLLADADICAGVSKLASFKLIIVPLLVDLPAEGVFALCEYAKSGGKLLVTDGGGIPSQSAEQILRLAGVSVTAHATMQDSQQLNWQREPLSVVEEFAIGTTYANVVLVPGASALAKWQDSTSKLSAEAIVRNNGQIFLTWAPGLQGEISTNASLLSLAMEDLCPTILQQAAVQISFAEYQTIEQELDFLSKRTDEAIKTAKQADLAVPFRVIQQNYESALSHKKAFEQAYSERKFLQADEEFKKTRQSFSLAYAQAMPVRPVEARSVWLDRGTIVATRNAAGMADLFDRLKKGGINTVYFETNNAGFPIYPSKLCQQNPEVAGWDPLAVAVKEAHKRQMELHAWCWIFAVGNIRHNPIIGRDPDYPGPVLATRSLTWALAAANGSFLPPNQPEFWLDPANPEVRAYAKDILLEVANNYAIDGIQLDYIRYPFNNKGVEMGFNWVGRTLFEKQTGLTLDKLDEQTRQVWMAWKTQQVNDFVRDVSMALRRYKPGLRMSAAVYAFPRRMRINAIQQEWETWVANGWVDMLNPMTYVTTAEDLSLKAGYVRETTLDKALVYPGLSIRQLDTAGLIEQLDMARVIGTLGTTMFAVAQLDDPKLDLLKLGPYRKQALLTPQSYPVRASRLLLDDFAAMVNRYLQDPHKHILSDQSSTNDVLAQIMSIQKDLHKLQENATADELEGIAKQVSQLHAAIKEWLRLEAFVQRGFRAQYIANYLSQVETILSYASQRARFQDQALAGVAL